MNSDTFYFLRRTGLVLSLIVCIGVCGYVRVHTDSVRQGIWTILEYPVVRAWRCMRAVHTWCIARTLYAQPDRVPASAYNTSDKTACEYMLAELGSVYHDTVMPLKRLYPQLYGMIVQLFVRDIHDGAATALIEGGARAGIVRDMIVTDGMYLVGRVSEVFPFHSRVVLLRDPACAVSAVCAESKAVGVYQGGGRSDGTMRFVQARAGVPPRIGEMVLSRGEGAVFPRGLIIGSVTSVEQAADYYRLTVQPWPVEHVEQACVIMRGAEFDRTRELS